MILGNIFHRFFTLFFSSKNFEKWLINCQLQGLNLCAMKQRGFQGQLCDFFKHTEKSSHSCEAYLSYYILAGCRSDTVTDIILDGKFSCGKSRTWQMQNFAQLSGCGFGLCNLSVKFCTPKFPTWQVREFIQTAQVLPLAKCENLHKNSKTNDPTAMLMPDADVTLTWPN